MSHVSTLYGVLTKELSVNWKIQDFLVLVFIFKSFIIHHKHTFHISLVTYLTVRTTLTITFENVFLCKVFGNFIMNILK
jgi:hypothetical protein